MNEDIKAYWFIENIILEVMAYDKRRKKLT